MEDLTQHEQTIKSWINAFHRYSDTLNAPEWMHNFFTPSATLVFANNPPIVGHDAIIADFEQQFKNLESMSHKLVDFVVNRNGSKVYLSAKITYVVKGDPEGREITIPGMAAAWRNSKGLIERFEVALDPTPLIARIVEVQSQKAEE